jgi:hypothetical protein
MSKDKKDPEGAAMYHFRDLSDDHLLSPDAACFPLCLPPTGQWRIIVDSSLFIGGTAASAVRLVGRPPKALGRSAGGG